MQKKTNKSIFLEYLGDTPQLRILDFLIDNSMFDYPVTQIAREAEVSYNSLKNIFPSLINAGIVKKTRKIGKSYYYQTNLNNEFIKNLSKLDWALTKQVSLNSSEQSPRKAIN